MIAAIVTILVIAAIVLLRSVVILKPTERGVVFRLGRVGPVVGPGIVILAPFVDQVTRVSMAEQQIEIPKLELTTKDGSSATVSARLRYRVVDPARSLIVVADLPSSLRAFFEKILRVIVGELEYEQLVSNLADVSAQVTRRLDENVGEWGIAVTSVEIERERF